MLTQKIHRNIRSVNKQTVSLGDNFLCMREDEQGIYWYDVEVMNECR